ncbi:MAG: SpoIIE family protein phosphatase [bacterium]|nr:SpoIIE family protein phosphatase [bacterium]
MRLKLKSLSIKTKAGLLYLFLAIVNITIFTSLIFYNQVELISKNTEYNVKEYSSNFIHYLNTLSGKWHSDGRSRQDVIKIISSEIENRNTISKSRLIKSFMIFTEEGEILHKSLPGLEIANRDLVVGMEALTSEEFLRTRYVSKINKETYELSSYIPLKVHTLTGSILLLRFKMEDFDQYVSSLYTIVSIVIGFIVVFHLVFAFFLFRLIIKPINSLHEKSLEISRGNLAVRADIKQEDEIGELGIAFNSMADSIQEKIEMLQKYNDVVESELLIAGDVQKNIVFPNIEETQYYKYSVFFKSFAKVSGDYYDIFDLGNSSYGFLLVDASGHGVPAALITMVAKEQFRLYAPFLTDPGELFKKINNEISEILQNAQGYYFTAFYLILDSDKKVHYCSGGHPTQFIIKDKMKEMKPLTTDGFLVGISKEMSHMYETRSMQLESGDKIVMFTDGITEQPDPDWEQYGIGRVMDSIKKTISDPGELILKSVIDDFSDFADPDNLKDDATLIIIDVK